MCGVGVCVYVCVMRSEVCVWGGCLCVCLCVEE